MSAEKQYARSEITYTLNGTTKNTIESLVSEQGIWKLFPHTEAQQNLVGTCIDVEVFSQRLRGRLVREEGDEGAHFNLKFVGLNQEDREKLKSKIQYHGFSSPWKRKYPRLSTNVNDPAIPIPTIAILKRFGGFTHAHVVNFTLDGVLIEFLTSGLSLSEKIGHHVEFDLQTNDDRYIFNLAGVIVRIYDEHLKKNGAIRGIAIKLAPMSAKNDFIYRDLIRAHCQALKKPGNA